MLDSRFIGLVVLANWLLADINVLADLEKNNIPTTILGRELKNDNISSVIVDNNLGARSALEHFIR
jgi:DNA-binding LacI/PurR family transcriptional regulator